MGDAARRTMTEAEFLRLPATSAAVKARLTSPLLPGFALDLRRLFARRR